MIGGGGISMAVEEEKTVGGGNGFVAVVMRLL